MNIGKVTIFLLAIFLLFSCTEKNNFVGYQNQNINQDTINVVLDSLTFYTSQDSSSNYHENPRLTIGNYFFDSNEIKSYSLLKFPDAPDSINEITNLNLKLYVADIGSATPIDLKIGKITKDWVENEVDIDNTYSDTIWVLEDEIEDLDLELNISDINSGDSILVDENLNLELFKELIKNEWANSENYGLVLYSESSDSHFQIYSSENYEDSLSTFKPHLTFEYNTIQNPDSVYVYEEQVKYDASVFTNPDNVEIIADRMIVSNGNIKRAVLKFDIPETDIEPTAVINKAELIFTNIQNYNPNNSWKIIPYLLTDEEPAQPMEFEDDYEIIENTIVTDEDFDENGEISINITAIFQSLISNEKDNNGILIKSVRENSNFGFTEFSEDVSLKVIYTNPGDF